MCIFTLADLKKQLHKVLGKPYVELKIFSHLQICKKGSKIKCKCQVGSGRPGRFANKWYSRSLPWGVQVSFLLCSVGLLCLYWKSTFPEM